MRMPSDHATGPTSAAVSARPEASVQPSGPCLGVVRVVSVVLADPDACLDTGAVLDDRADRVSAARPVSELGDAAVQEAQFLEDAAGVGVHGGGVRGEAGRAVPHLAEQLLHVLADFQFDRELPQFVQVLQQDGVGYMDDVGGDADRVAVHIDEAEAALGIDVAQEPGDPAVRAGDHHVPQGRLPRRVGPDPGEDGGGNGQRTHHPLLDVGQAPPLVPLQPLRQLPEADDRRIVLRLGRNGLQRRPFPLRQTTLPASRATS
ncbi:hypothetical protein SBADM41S_04163 [Streptomyces badius]